MVRVRDSFPTLSYLPVTPNFRSPETVFRDIVDSDASSARGFDENVPLVDLESSSPKAPDSSLGNDNGIVRPNTEPIVKISPPTPLKKPPKSDATMADGTRAEEQRACVVAERKTAIKRASSYDESRSLDAPSQNSIMPHDGSGDGKVYSKKTCPFHRHEPAVKIFDDDIEKYLIDDPRTNVSSSSNQKLSKSPLPRQASKYRKAEGKITSGKKIKTVTLPQKKSDCRPDGITDLTANKIASGESKNNDSLDDQREIKPKTLDSRPDVPSPRFKFIPGKGRRSANDSRIVTLLPKLPPSRGKVEAFGKLITSRAETCIYSESPATQHELVDEAE